MSPKEEFIAIFTENIKREGARELLAWLETTDFFLRTGQHQVPLCLRGRPGAAFPERLPHPDGPLF